MRHLFVGLVVAMAFATAFFAFVVGYSMVAPIVAHHFPTATWLSDDPRIDLGGLAAVLLGTLVGVQAAREYKREGRFSWKRQVFGLGGRRLRS